MARLRPRFRPNKTGEISVPMKLASRIGQVPEYLFVQVSRKIAEKRSQGIEVISFGIGDPDIPTPKPIIDELRSAAITPLNHRYPESEGLPEFREAVAKWYGRRFGVGLDPETEVLSLIGAKEGIGHVALSFLEPGDVALVPDPGYPVYAVGTLFAGGESYALPLTEDNGWLPDLDSVPDDVSQRATLLWINYPNNPTGATADLRFFEKAIAFGRKHDVAIMHDACYTDVAYEGYRPPSFLEVSGSKDVGMEFHSLSKTYNMTGWRIGMVVGNADMIEALRVVKSNLDSGVPQAVQHMGVAAMNLGDDILAERNAVYQRRMNQVVAALKSIGLSVELPRAGLYVWARVPEGYTSAEFSERLLDERDVLVSAGSGYGKQGEGYVRLSMTLSDEDVDKASDRISSWEIPAPMKTR